jgi:hypothetical protein
MDIMTPQIEPTLTFSGWRAWALRGDTRREFDVPQEYDLPGIYLFAHSKSGAPKEGKAIYASPAVIYIGVSKQTTIRMQGGNHRTAVKAYREKFGDPTCKQLYFACGTLDALWSNWSLDNTDDGKAKMAYLLYLERKVIWEHVKQTGRLPRLNKC